LPQPGTPVTGHNLLIQKVEVRWNGHLAEGTTCSFANARRRSSLRCKAVCCSSPLWAGTALYGPFAISAAHAACFREIR
jgi:hypothetical protein